MCPRILSNDGFRVNAEEARIMARIASNFVEVQRSLPASNTEYIVPTEWPMKIREDFVVKFEQFAEWASMSNGFTIR